MRRSWVVIIYENVLLIKTLTSKTTFRFAVDAASGQHTSFMRMAIFSINEFEESQKHFFVISLHACRDILQYTIDIYNCDCEV